MKKVKTPKMIYVVWNAHYSHRDDWGPADYSKCPEGMPYKTVGFLVGETKKCIRVALNVCVKATGVESADTITIPKSCIVKRKYLR